MVNGIDITTIFRRRNTLAKKYNNQPTFSFRILLLRHDHRRFPPTLPAYSSSYSTIFTMISSPSSATKSTTLSSAISSAKISAREFSPTN